MHVALICPDMTGHLNPMTTLGVALGRRGHRVSLIGSPDSQAIAESRGLDFFAIGEAEYNDGTQDAARQKLSRLQGIAALNFTGKMLCWSSQILHRDLPEVLNREGVEVLLWDQIYPAGESVAEWLGLPHGMVCNALAIHAESNVPPAVVGWPCSTSRLSRIRNQVGNFILRMAGRPLEKEVNRFRRQHGIASRWNPMKQTGGKIQIAQQPEFFDFPREQLPSHFHYTGPWHAENRDAGQTFPWNRLNGRPLVYASLGTLQNGCEYLFDAILAACQGLEVQLVLSLGGSQIEIAAEKINDAILVRYAPQIELLKRAEAMITHAGLNTALEALTQGVPMVAIPITNDQPGVARRLEMLGAAQYLRPSKASAGRIRSALQAVLADAKYRAAAKQCQAKIQASPSVDDAAALVESAFG